MEFAGKSVTGVTTKVEIPISNPREFLMVMAAGFQDAERGTPSTDHIIPIRQLVMGLAASAETGAKELMIVEVGVADFRLRFAASLGNLGSDKIQAIEHHIAALMELLAPEMPGGSRH